MKTPYSLQNIKRQHPELDQFRNGELNKRIFRSLQRFTNDKSILISSLIQNPYGKTNNIFRITKKLGPDVAEKIVILNKLHDLDPSIMHQWEKFREEIALFLTNFIFTLSDQKKPKNDLGKIEYAQKLLKKLHIGEIYSALDDKFFAILYPEIYQSYQLLLKFTQKTFKKKQQEIKRSFEKLLSDNDIEATIETRFKSICSIHKKIIKKELLFSQVLDVIGIRIIVNQEEDCYQSMVLILKNASILTNRIKDYIAAPKNNGYQSIHLTIMHENHPVEIQIRTRDMHWRAQYGRYSHVNYKKATKK